MAILVRQAPPLAELYESALIMLYQEPLPARVRLICHAVREIGNRLPYYVAGEVTGTRLHYKDRLDRIAKLFESDELPTDGSLPAAPVTGGEPVPALPPGNIIIPETAYRGFAELLRDHAETSNVGRQRAASMFEALEPEAEDTSQLVEPGIRRWLSVVDWFMGRVHDSGEANDIYDHEIEQRFAAFEAVLASLVGGFYPTLDELDDVLDKANC